MPPAVSASSEKKSDVFGTGEEGINESDLSTIELETYDLRELFLNNTALYFFFLFRNLSL